MGSRFIVRLFAQRFGNFDDAKIVRIPIACSFLTLKMRVLTCKRLRLQNFFFIFAAT